jgi:tetratricopeptide (TPR) repeat protein
LKAFPEHEAEAIIWLARAHFQLEEREQGLAQLADLECKLSGLNDSELFMLVQMLIRYRAFSRAQAVIDHARSARIGSAWLQHYQGQVHYERKNYDAALGILTGELIDSCKDSASRQDIYFMRGRSLEATGRSAEAHACFTAMNRLARDAYSRRDSANIVAGYSGISHDDLPTLSQTEVRHLRKAYFEYTENYVADIENAAIIVDKLPLNILHIPFVQVLFPGTKFLFSLRHPIDVCLSCFQQNFLMTDAMSYFTSLDETFARYRDVMELLDRYRATLNPEILTVRYENLVTDLDGVASEIFAFLDYEPDKKYRDFHKVGKEQIIRMRSRSQVTQRLYDSSCDRWKNYADELEPYIPIVQEFIDKYGYAEQRSD